MLRQHTNIPQSFRDARISTLLYHPNNSIITESSTLQRDLSGSIFLCTNNITILLPSDPSNGCTFTFLKDSNDLTTIHSDKHEIKSPASSDRVSRDVHSSEAYSSCTLVFYSVEDRGVWYVINNSGWVN